MKRVFVGAAIAGLTLLTWFQFPGHTWLQQDSQIYAAILEHLSDPSVLNNDILVQRPHVAFTLYDEIARGLRRVTGLDFHAVLSIEQIVTRGLGIWGVYLFASALGLSAVPALFVSAIFCLGATIVGPAVLTFEYEPTPRAFAVPLLFLAIGLASRGYDTAAAVAGSAAFLFHPPTSIPFWVVYGFLAILRRRIRVLIVLSCAIAILLLAAWLQPGIAEKQQLFARVEPALEALQRLRADYNWISIWWRDLLPQYLVLYAATLAAAWRLRNASAPGALFFSFAMPLAGILSLPLSWMLLEQMKWSLIPQIQPMRALLFVTAFAVILSAAAGCTAVREKRYIEAYAWFALAYLIPAQARIFTLPAWNRAAVIAVLALAAVPSLKAHRIVPAAAVAIAAFFVLPLLGRITNYPMLHTPELAELSQWARGSTPQGAIFLFADSGKALLPGIFRAESLRAVYVDWKGGGQVNFLPELGFLWWERWQRTMAAPFDPRAGGRYAGTGIDFLVLTRKNALSGATPVFQNAKFLVYGMRR